MYVLYPPPLYSGSCYPIGGITSSSEMPPQFDSYVDMCTYPYMNRHIYLCLYYNHTPPPSITSRLVLPYGWHHVLLRDASLV